MINDMSKWTTALLCSLTLFSFSFPAIHYDNHQYEQNYDLWTISCCKDTGSVCVDLSILGCYSLKIIEKFHIGC